RKVRDAYSGAQDFSNPWFWSFLFFVLNFFILVGIMLALLAVLILITALPGGVGWLTRICGTWFVQHLSTLGWIGCVISFAGLIVVYLEWIISFNSLRHWLRKRQIERILANRIKRDLPGIFKIINENCEDVAKGISDRLKTNPDWLFGTLVKR